MSTEAGFASGVARHAVIKGSMEGSAVNKVKVSPTDVTKLCQDEFVLLWQRVSDTGCREARNTIGLNSSGGKFRLRHAEGILQVCTHARDGVGSSSSGFLPPMCHVMAQGCPHAAQIGPLSLPRPVIRFAVTRR